VIQHLTAEPESLRARRPELPEALDDLVLMMLAKEAVDRPSIAEIHEVLAAIVVEEMETDADDVSLELELEAEVPDAADVVELHPYMARPRWTPPIVPDGERSSVSGEIELDPVRAAVQTRREAGKADTLGMAVTVLMAALMLFAAMALPAFQLGTP
jgi:hypothetical protein